MHANGAEFMKENWHDTPGQRNRSKYPCLEWNNAHREKWKVMKPNERVTHSRLRGEPATCGAPRFSPVGLLPTVHAINNDLTVQYWACGIHKDAVTLPLAS